MFKVGEENKPFTKKLQIVLSGTQQDTQTITAPTIAPTNKSIVNRGQLYINAQTPSTQFLRLTSNALIGQTVIQLNGTPDWQVGDRIAISSTSQNYQQFESVKIVSINDSLITVEPALKYNHFGNSIINTVKGNLDMRAEVMLLTRNVVITGDDAGNWGCTVQTIGFNDVDDGKFIYGRAYFKGVQFDKCGQYNETWGAVSFLDLKNASNSSAYSMEYCSITNSLGIALASKKTDNLSVTHTNIYNA